SRIAPENPPVSAGIRSRPRDVTNKTTHKKIRIQVVSGILPFVYSCSTPGASDDNPDQKNVCRQGQDRIGFTHNEYAPHVHRPPCRSAGRDPITGDVGQRPRYRTDAPGSRHRGGGWNPLSLLSSVGGSQGSDLFASMGWLTF